MPPSFRCGRPADASDSYSGRLSTGWGVIAADQSQLGSGHIVRFTIPLMKRKGEWSRVKHGREPSEASHPMKPLAWHVLTTASGYADRSPALLIFGDVYCGLPIIRVPCMVDHQDFQNWRYGTSSPPSSQPRLREYLSVSDVRYGVGPCATRNAPLGTF